MKTARSAAALQRWDATRNSSPSPCTQGEGRREGSSDRAIGTKRAHALSRATPVAPGPEGAKGCSRGWSAAQPVDISEESLAPAGATEMLPRLSPTPSGQLPTPLRGGLIRTLRSTGCARPRLASPVATFCRPVGTECPGISFNIS
jgi:hypothetical protein